MTWVAFVLLGFFLGSLPFSVWLGKWFLGVDVRRYGDGNPGSSNAFKAGSKSLGLLVLILDISKAAVPVGTAYFNLGIRGLPMLLIATAPILGHAFSPFLGFRGGKALSTALGVWIGLTLWKASLPAVIAVAVGIGLLTSPGWAVMLALGVIFLVLLVWIPDPLLMAVLAVETIILAWKHRGDLHQAPHLRSWLAKLFFRTKGQA